MTLGAIAETHTPGEKQACGKRLAMTEALPGTNISTAFNSSIPIHSISLRFRDQRLLTFRFTSFAKTKHLLA
jgi:hypothetical protein